MRLCVCRWCSMYSFNLHGLELLPDTRLTNNAIAFVSYLTSSPSCNSGTILAYLRRQR